MGIKGICKEKANSLWKDQANGGGVLGSQSPRGSMRMVLIALDGFLHLSANIISHIGAVINNPRHSRPGNSGLSGNVFEGKRGHLSGSWFGSAPTFHQPDIVRILILTLALLYIVLLWERSQDIIIIRHFFKKSTTSFLKKYFGFYQQFFKAYTSLKKKHSFPM
jgi:hypothetical protein